MQAELALAVDDSAYRIWLAPLRPCELDERRLLLEAPPGACAWIRDRFGRVLASCAAEASGAGVSVELVDRRAREHEDDEPPTRSPRTARERTPSPERERQSRPGPLANPKLTFEQ